MRILAVALAVVLVPTLAASQAQPPSANLPQVPRLAFSVVGEAPAEPDRVAVGFMVQNEAPTAGAAMEQSAREMAALLAALRRHGVKADDIRTTGLGVHVIRHPDEKPVTYMASNTVRARLAEPARVGRLIDAGFKAGADNLTQLRFEVEDPRPLVIKARRDALAQAEETAREYAAGGGFRNMRLVQVSEGQAGIPRWGDGTGVVVTGSRMAALAPSTQVMADDMKATVHLSVVYEFTR